MMELAYQEQDAKNTTYTRKEKRKKKPENKGQRHGHGLARATNAPIRVRNTVPHFLIIFTGGCNNNNGNNSKHQHLPERMF